MCCVRTVLSLYVAICMYMYVRTYIIICNIIIILHGYVLVFVYVSRQLQPSSSRARHWLSIARPGRSCKWNAMNSKAPRVNPRQATL